MIKIAENDRGLTYTIEAILGIALIIGTLIFTTGNLPYTAQKTGDYSKVQLVNIGRDAMDLVELTPITDIFNNYSVSQGVYRNYTLVANRTFVSPGGYVEFTVYYLDTDKIFYQNLILTNSTLGKKDETYLAPINGTTNITFNSPGDYNIRAVDELFKGFPKNNWSNYVTIHVGYYFLDTDVNGIAASGSKIVDGVVYNSSGFGIPNLKIEILDSNKNVIIDTPPINPVTNTSYGRIIEDFENASAWTSDTNKSLNNTFFTQGSNSLSLNGTSSFWIKRTNSTTYNLNYYDILSFDFLSTTAGEKIDIELSNSTDSSNKFIWKNISIYRTGWNKINFNLKYPDKIEGNLTSVSIDTINITVSNITSLVDYFIDNLTAGAGNFAFIWPFSKGGKYGAGSYYIQANDSYGNTSNQHRIIFSDLSGSWGILYADKYVIYETETTNITLIPDGKADLKPTNKFNINQEWYDNKTFGNRIIISDPINPPNNTIVIFTGNTAGDYYIFVGNSGMGKGSDPAAAAKTNTILIQVLPLQADCVFVECPTPKCSGLRMTDLNFYLRNYVPYYVNYNLYLINPDGTLCKDCPEFKEIINGYPTDEAVTVNKIFRLKTVNGEYLRELRMVLWYK